MYLLLTYVILIVLGQGGVVGISLLADQWYGPGVSVTVFFVMFFAMFWAAWKLSVRLTEPKTA